MEITLRKKSWHSMLYMWTYCLTKSTHPNWRSKEDHAYYCQYSSRPYKFDLPDNLCQYFWQLVVAIISLPLTVWCLPGQLFGIKPGGYWFRLGFSFITIMIIAIIAGLSMRFMTDPYNNGMLILKLVGTIIGVIAFIALAVYVISFFRDLSETDTAKIVQAKIASKKSNICPKINWEEKK